MTGVIVSERKDLIRKQFAIQARTYPSTARLLAEKAQPMLDLARPEPDESALDVASGWGFVALALAPFVRSVIGVDLTPEMLARARDLLGYRPAVSLREGLRRTVESFRSSRPR